MARLGRLTEYLAMSVGAAHLEIGTVSALRPDGMMARFTNKARVLLPSPADRWAADCVGC